MNYNFYFFICTILLKQFFNNNIINQMPVAIGRENVTPKHKVINLIIPIVKSQLTKIDKIVNKTNKIPIIPTFPH